MTRPTARSYPTRPLVSALARVARQLCTIGLAVAVLAPAAQAAAVVDVGEIGSYTQIYQLNILASADYNGAGPAYGVNNASTAIAGGISRIAYYMELQSGTNPANRQWVWASMNAYTQNLGQIGLPVSSTGAVWQQRIASMNVESNVSSIVTGTGIATGNIEFWHQCYGTGNALNLPGANSGLYDFDDNYSGGNCYGSMQVHNYGARQTLMAYNAWDTGGQDDLGIGNRGSANPDWTFAGNAGSYTIRSLEVWVQATVQPMPEPASLALVGVALIGVAASRRRARG